MNSMKLYGVQGVPEPAQVSMLISGLVDYVSVRILNALLRDG